MEKKIIYGAGAICKKILPIIAKEAAIEAIIDGNESNWGKNIYGVPIISIEEYLANYKNYEIIIATNYKNYKEIASLLMSKGIKSFFLYKEKFNIEEMDDRERLVSYSMPSQMEDVILYNVFSETDDIFYIDVGSNDPLVDSVTKLLYDTKNARGINIEPQQWLINFTNRERKRDINICLGVGEQEKTSDFYIQGGLSTILEENVSDTYSKNKTSIHITTLKKICDQYIDKDQNICFLKIDVEGYEKNVLLGADFKAYRPMVVLMESTLPTTNIPCYDEWEYILIENNYHFIFEYGVNRYYVANEHSELDDKFIPILDLMKKYCVYTIKI